MPRIVSFLMFQKVTIAVKALFPCQNVAETVSAYQNVPAVMVNRGLLPISEVSHCEPPTSRPATHHLQCCNVMFQEIETVSGDLSLICQLQRHSLGMISLRSKKPGPNHSMKCNEIRRTVIIKFDEFFVVSGCRGAEKS